MLYNVPFYFVNQNPVTYYWINRECSYLLYTLFRFESIRAYPYSVIKLPVICIAQDTSELFFDDVRLPSSALLGEANRGFYYLMKELPQERLNVGIAGCARSEAMFEWTRKYVKERKAFGKTISSLQVYLSVTLLCPLLFSDWLNYAMAESIDPLRAWYLYMKQKSLPSLLHHPFWYHSSYSLISNPAFSLGVSRTWDRF